MAFVIMTERLVHDANDNTVLQMNTLNGVNGVNGVSGVDRLADEFFFLKRTLSLIMRFEAHR